MHITKLTRQQRDFSRIMASAKARGSSVFHVIRSNPKIAVGGGIVAFFVLIALAAPLLTPYDPDAREPPSLVHPPSGCRFHPRCPYAMPICSQSRPPRTNLGNGHWTHCFLYSNGERTPEGDTVPASRNFVDSGQ